jgi:hypothetical protein
MFVSVGLTPALALKVRRVLVDGEDVTDRCFQADDETGCVLLYSLNADGAKYVTTDDLGRECVAWERRTGNVVILFKEAIHG